MYMAAMYIMHEKHGCGPRRKSRHTYVHAYNHTFIIYIYIFQIMTFIHADCKICREACTSSSSNQHAEGCGSCNCTCIPEAFWLHKGTNWIKLVQIIHMIPMFPEHNTNLTKLAGNSNPKMAAVSPVSSRTCSRVAFLASASCHHASETITLVSSPIAIHGPNS